MSLRLIFMGTPDFAVPTLLELVAHGHEIAAVYTRAAKPAGRGMKLQPTPVERRETIKAQAWVTYFANRSRSISSLTF